MENWHSSLRILNYELRIKLSLFSATVRELFYRDFCFCEYRTTLVVMMVESCVRANLVCNLVRHHYHLKSQISVLAKLFDKYILCSQHVYRYQVRTSAHQSEFRRRQQYANEQCYAPQRISTLHTSPHAGH